MKNIRRTAFAILSSMAVTCAGPAVASEGGTLNIPVGANTLMTGLMPQAGQTFIQNYTVRYKADRFNDSNGHSSVPGFSLDVLANGTRFFHGWGKKVGPFQLGSAVVVVSVVNSKLDTPFGSSDHNNLGNIILEPFMLGWTNDAGNFMSFATVDIYVPLDKSRPASYTSIDPNFAFTWFPLPYLEVSGLINLEVPQKNDDTKYRSGVSATADWGISVHPFQNNPAITFGLGGYFVKQLTDDKQNGRTVGNGNKQRAFALGPQVSYGARDWGVVLKYQHEVHTENRGQGNLLWLQAMFAF